jgi:hypothetical protein
MASEGYSERGWVRFSRNPPRLRPPYSSVRVEFTRPSGRRSSRPVRAKLLGTTKRTGGALQVTYRGHPLYTFKLEHAGQTKGEGDTDAGPPFYAVSPSGAAVVK